MGMGKREEPSKPPSTMPGIWKYPTNRDDSFHSGINWLRGRVEDDGAEGLWRIYDDLYDFSSWIHNHPGGSDWLTLTKGTDITEAFEAHHIALTAERLLPHFHVRKAATRRNSPYTFKPDGFYKTLKNRIREEFKGQLNGPTFRSKLSADLLLTAAISFGILATKQWNYLYGYVSGFFLALCVISAHNFFHQKDNFRMRYFDLSLMSTREWRISHALSHHLYPNTILDLEISMMEPFIQWLPRPDKTWWARYGPLFYSPLVYMTMFHFAWVKRHIQYLRGVMKGPTAEELIPYIFPLILYMYTGVSVLEAICMWQWIILCSSFTFACIGLNAAHHHPAIFHDGDAPREDMDWAIQQLDAVRDRPIVCRYNFLALVTFGHHGLHHIFPTIDHGKLDKFQPIFEKTCRDFNIPYEMFSVKELIVGQFQQCARNEINPVPPKPRSE